MVKFTERQISDINALLKQLTNKPKRVNEEVLNEILSQSGVFILVVKNSNGKIIAMATLAIRRLFPGKTAKIESVVVDKKHRGKKLGKRIMERLIEKARLEEALFVSLTTHPSRKEANRLYQSLGFKLIGNIGESNYYRLLL